jgi:hypothetical protein
MFACPLTHLPINKRPDMMIMLRRRYSMTIKVAIAV